MKPIWNVPGTVQYIVSIVDEVYTIPIVWVTKIGDGVLATERSAVFYRETTAFNRGPTGLFQYIVTQISISIGWIYLGKKLCVVNINIYVQFWLLGISVALFGGLACRVVNISGRY